MAKISDENIISIYCESCTRLDAYGGLQFKYRSLCATIVGAYFAAIPFLYAPEIDLQIAVVLALILTFVVLFAVAVISFFDFLHQEFVESTIRSLERLERLLYRRGLRSVLPFDMKRRNIGPLMANLAISFFYGVSILMVAVILWVCASIVGNGFLRNQIASFVTASCQRELGIGNDGLASSDLASCIGNRTGGQFDGFSQTLSIFVLFAAILLVTVFLAISAHRLFLSFYANRRDRVAVKRERMERAERSGMLEKAVKLAIKSELERRNVLGLRADGDIQAAVVASLFPSKPVPRRTYRMPTIIILMASATLILGMLSLGRLEKLPWS
jgi:hypothetical protein